SINSSDEVRVLDLVGSIGVCKILERKQCQRFFRISSKTSTTTNNNNSLSEKPSKDFQYYKKTAGNQKAFQKELKISKV
ncbi:hypothetical protein Dsin_031318, partial [Dipteronia sinensis]